MADALGIISTTDELAAIVDRRLGKAREDMVRARENGETLDENYMRGQVHELMMMQDLIAAILKRPRTHYAS